MRHATTRIVIAAVLVSIGTATASERGALQHTTPQQRADVQTQYMKEHLDLTDEQLSKITQINLDYAKQADPLIKGSEGDLTLLKEMKALGQKKDAALKEVLTSQQFETYQSFKKQMDNAVASAAEKATTSKGNP